MQRRIAFCVDRWSADSTLFSWTYAKQFFLRKQRTDDGKEVLSDLDQLFVLHVGRGKEGWDSGGPILPRLSTALENYPHTIVELEGRDVAATLVEFATREHMDIMIIGSRENRNAAQKMLPGTTVGSISENVKARAKIPCLIVRPSSARNERLRIKSLRNLSELTQQTKPGMSLPQPLKVSVLTAQVTPEPRKVCIAFEHTESGNNMISWAAKNCLFPDDDIYLVHCTNMGALEKMQKSASFQRAMLKPRMSRESHDIQDTVDLDEIGKEDLQNFEEPLRVRLKGDAKTELVDYSLEKHMDLCIVGFNAASRMKKALSGGSLTTHLLQNGACPILVIPLKAMAWEEADTVSQLPEIRPPSLDGPGLVENEAISPSASLGPRVSISRSLSHQLSQASRAESGLIGRRATADRPFGPSRAPPPRVQRMMNKDGEAEVSASQPILQPTFERTTQASPFEPASHLPRESIDFGDLPGTSPGADNSQHGLTAQTSTGQSHEMALLQQQLREKDAHIRILEDELRQLRLQTGSHRGGSPPGRAAFLA